MTQTRKSHIPTVALLTVIVLAFLMAFTVLSMSGCKSSSDQVQTMIDDLDTAKLAVKEIQAQKKLLEGQLAAVDLKDAKAQERIAQLTKALAESDQHFETAMSTATAMQERLKRYVESGQGANGFQIVGEGVGAAAPALGPFAGYAAIASTILLGIGNIVQRIQTTNLKKAQDALQSASINAIASIEAVKDDDGKVDFTAQAKLLDLLQTPEAKQLVDRAQTYAGQLQRLLSLLPKPATPTL